MQTLPQQIRDYLRSTGLTIKQFAAKHGIPLHELHMLLHGQGCGVITWKKIHEVTGIVYPENTNGHDDRKAGIKSVGRR